jgi:hypothetical protein
MDIVVYKTEQRLDVQQVRSVPTQAIESDWGGTGLTQGYCWSFVVDAESLWFTAAVPASPPADRVHSCGDFVEGLWEADVAEFFLMNARGEYQEFNLSPDGAWWSMLFASYRERSPRPRTPEGIVVSVDRSAQSWRVAFGVQRTQLQIAPDEVTAIHVSGILYGGGEGRYLSSAGQPSFAPDFHDRRCFGSVRWEPFPG